MIIFIAAGTFLDILIQPWLVLLDAPILAAVTIYLVVRRRQESIKV